MEKAPVRKFKKDEILGLIPAQAIIDFDRAEGVLQKIGEWYVNYCHEYYTQLLPSKDVVIEKLCRMCIDMNGTGACRQNDRPLCDVVKRTADAICGGNNEQDIAYEYKTTGEKLIDRFPPSDGDM